MRKLILAALSAVVAAGLACSSGAQTSQMAPCAGCKMECPKDKVCPKDGKCMKCDGCAKPAMK
jgi:hypothetical protein